MDDLNSAIENIETVEIIFTFLFNKQMLEKYISFC